jgi:MFS family permease
MPTANAREATTRTAAIAWLMAAVYYFYQYSLRSAPAVMMPQLSEAFGLGATGVASIIGLFYYGYSAFSLAAGVAMDRFGPRRVVPIGAALVGAGALLFASGNTELASAGRVLQGSGGAFAIVGAIYIATQYFEPSRAATLIGATQMFGMAGGFAGQFAVGPLIAAGVAWSHFWLGMGVVGLAISAPLYFLLPGQHESPPAQPVAAGASESALRSAARALGAVFRNPQTILCGMIAGLLFIPTTIFDMVWGVRYLQEAIGYDYGASVMRSAMVPLGWIIGCPLLGWISDQLGRRKPVIAGGAALLLACLAWILYGPTDVLPPYVMGLLTGLGSGAAMLPTTVAKEANTPELGGTTVGAVTFVNFTFSALLGPVFASTLRRASSGAAELERAHFQMAFEPLLYGVGLAILLLFFLKETGSAARTAAR